MTTKPTSAPKRCVEYKPLLPLLLAGLFTLSGCSSSDDADDATAGGDTSGQQNGLTVEGTLVVATAASDFTSGAVALVDTLQPFAAQTGLNAGGSDLKVRVVDDHYYVLRGFLSDSVSRFAISDPATAIFESSTNDGTDTAPSNPADLAIVDETKGYLVRYGSPKVWIVNPSAQTAGEFKIGEIDLSAYDPDGVPEATRAAVVDGKLFVFMQRLEAFSPVRSGYVAVFDTSNDVEIDTQGGGALKGIELPAFNPNNISVDPATGSIFVAAVGNYADFSNDSLSGGIVVVDTADYSTTALVDDNETIGRISDVQVVDATSAYMITTNITVDSNVPTETSLVQFDPNTGNILANPAAGLSGVDIRDIAVGPAGNLWVAVADAESPGLIVINPADNSVIEEKIGTLLNPIDLSFAQFDDVSCMSSRRLTVRPCRVLCVCAAAMLIFCTPRAHASDQLPTVASINVCADQLVMLLAEPAQIVSLSNLSQDKAASYFYKKAASFSVNRGYPEEVLPLKPDLVIVGEYSNRYTVQLLNEVGLHTETLPIENSIEDMFNNIRKVAGWLQREQRGEDIINGLEERLAAITPGDGLQPLAAVYDANGYTSGPNTMRGRMLSRAGWRNAAAVAGIDSFGKLSLEALIRLAPDALLASPYSQGTYSRAQAVSRHPALLMAGLNPVIINVPSRMTICAGPWSVDVVELLYHKRQQVQQSIAGRVSPQ